MRIAAPCLFALALARTAAAQPDPTPPAEPPSEPAPAPPSEPAPSDPAAAPDPAPSEPAPPPSPPSPPPQDPAPPVGSSIPDAPTPAPASSDLGFRFGSYGRVLAGTDLRGGKPESANIVAHGPRVVEDSYLELDFSYGMDAQHGIRLRPVITLAFDGTLFHDTGNFDAQPALRNLFLDAQVSRELSLWVGSRMYRGDDIYLFDYWPLDDLNTVGAGVQYRKDALELAVHAGVNRLEEGSEFQFQEIDVPDPEQGARTIVQLNRQRMVASASAAYTVPGKIELPNLKLKLHGEVHGLPGGTRERADGFFEDLPSDTGYLVGLQVGTYGFAPAELGYRRHANFFARYAKGLAAFDELAPPSTFGADLEASRASELSFGVSANWDHALGNVMLGALSRRFIDADGNAVDFQDGWEYAVDVRPLAHLARGLFAGVDLSYQARFPRGLNPNTQRAQDPAVFQVAPMLVFSPVGPSGYDRPQLRFVYRIARLNEAARDLFVPDDPRHQETWTYFLGFQAEWWFNSTTYRR